MPAYIEDPADDFDFETDWFEVAEDRGASGANLSLESQESTRVGYVRANKLRSAVRFFLGYSEADTSAPWRLRRELPNWDPELPWLFAHSVSAGPVVLKPNEDNPDEEPYLNSPFATDGQRYTSYKWRLLTVKYRAFKGCKFWPDSSIEAATDEYKRFVIASISGKIEALSADGVSNLIFAETGTGGPSLTPPGTPFPAPLTVLLPKATITLEWLNVDRAYISNNPNILFPTKLFACMGTVNSAEFMGFEAGTLLCQPPEIIENPSPVASDTAADVEYDPLTNVNVRFHFDYFKPEAGATSPVTQGHNLMAWRQNQKFYLATRDGTTDLAKAFLRYTEFKNMFTHVSS
jgi:hypothetical protein